MSSLVSAKRGTEGRLADRADTGQYEAREIRAPLKDFSWGLPCVRSGWRDSSVSLLNNGLVSCVFSFALFVYDFLKFNWTKLTRPIKADSSTR